MREKISLLTRGAAIAALYASLTLILQPISYGPCQVRVSEALTLTPALWPEAIPGLFVGCFIANVLGGYGLWDIFLGSAATLLAAFLTRKAKNDFLAAASPVVVNALVVGFYMSYVTGMPTLMWMLNVGVGEMIACFALGLPLLRFLRRTRFSGQK
ncbi:MAG: QueT transporter family protein [Synergistaceae bacterium]|jgi:uncharacterized membrane protein|nr:QueT transporter family protein [Synergistaceae bacterium]